MLSTIRFSAISPTPKLRTPFRTHQQIPQVIWDAQRRTWIPVQDTRCIPLQSIRYDNKPKPSEDDSEYLDPESIWPLP